MRPECHDPADMDMHSGILDLVGGRWLFTLPAHTRTWQHPLDEFIPTQPNLTP